MKRVDKKGSFLSKVATATDKVASWISPRWGFNRMRARTDMARMELGYRATERTIKKQFWGGAGGTGDKHLDARNLRDTRDQSRQQDRDNPIAHGIIKMFGRNIIGTGIKIESASSNDEFRLKATELFNAWAEDEADYTRQQSLDEMELTHAMAKFRDGDSFEIRTNDGSLQAIEGDFVIANKSTNGKNRIINGVELNSKGRPVNYWICPPDQTGSFPDTAKSRPFKADNVSHLYSKERFSLTRGVPALTQILQIIEDIDEFVAFSLDAAKINSLYTMAIESGDPDLQSAMGVKGVDSANPVDGSETVDKILEMDSSQILQLLPGEKLQGIGSTRPSNNEASFIRINLRIAGMCIGFPLEMLFLDFSDTNFSSAKGAIIEGQKTIRIEQKPFVKHKRRVYLWKISQWMADPNVDLPFVPDWKKVTIQVPGQDWIDPLKEAMAAEKSITSGLDSITSILAAKGKDVKDVFTQHFHEIVLAQTLADQAKAEGVDDISWKDFLAVAKGALLASSNTKPSGTVETRSNGGENEK